MVIGVPWFLLELKHLATPGVMASGKELSNPLSFSLLGTSNISVWGIDECSNTHHFCTILTAKNIQKHPWMHQNDKNIANECFICFRCKNTKNR